MPINQLERREEGTNVNLVKSKCLSEFSLSGKFIPSPISVTFIRIFRSKNHILFYSCFFSLSLAQHNCLKGAMVVLSA